MNYAHGSCFAVFSFGEAATDLIHVNSEFSPVNEAIGNMYT